MLTCLQQKLFTTAIMRFDAVLIGESSFNIYFKRFFWYQAIFCHFYEESELNAVLIVHACTLIPEAVTCSRAPLSGDGFDRPSPPDGGVGLS